MSSYKVPSASLLRYLSRLARRPHLAQHIRCYEPQRRCFSQSDRYTAKASKLAPSPRARRATREAEVSQVSARHSGIDVREQLSSVQPLTDVLFNEYVTKDYADLGLHHRANVITPSQFVLESFLHALKLRRLPVGIAEWFTGTGEKCLDENGNTFAEVLSSQEEHRHLRPLADPQIMGQAIYILGYQFIMSTQKDQRDLGEVLLKVAELMRNRDAAMATLLSNYRRKSVREATPQAFSILNSLVNQGHDIAAMCLAAEVLMWPKMSNVTPTAAQRSQAYDLARKAFERSEAGPPIPAPPPPRIAGPVSYASGASDTAILPPWLLLLRIIEHIGKESSVENLALWKKALLAGARDYDDPDACAQAISPPSPIVPVGSEDWINLATQAAMAGKDPAAVHLARYYLEHHGWFPPNLTSRRRNRAGFQWMEVSLMQTDHPAEIQRRALLMALLLRENGDSGSGMRWLEIGADRIDQVAQRTNANVQACAKVSRHFALCREKWRLPIPELSEAEPSMALEVEEAWKAPVNGYHPLLLSPKHAVEHAVLR